MRNKRKGKANKFEFVAEHMNYLALKDVCCINMGQSPDSKSYNDSKEGIPFFQGNADFGERYPITRVWCNAPTKTAEKDDILISVRAPIGALNYAKETCCIGRGLAAITPNKTKVSTEFIFWLLKGKNNELNRLGTGSTFKAISKKILEETKVPDISLEKQTAYSNILEKLYSIITHRRTQLEKLDLLVKARFVEMFGDPNDKRVSEKQEKIGDLCDVTKLAGFEFTEYINYQESGEIIMLRGLNCKQGKLVLDNVKYIDRNTSYNLPRSRLYVGDILMTYAGTIGEVAIVDEDDKYHLAPNVAKISIIKKDKVNPIFLVHLFMYSHDYIMTFASQVAQASINMQKIRDFRYTIPNIEEQYKFANFVKQVDKSKVVLQSELEKTQMLFDSLMQEYFG